jgi:MYXO-CTERM domain-containing protein
MQIRNPMKKISALAAAALFSVATVQAAIVFNPANPLFVDDQGGFTGTASIGGTFVNARVQFVFTGLALPTSFQISNILLKGDGITGSLSFSSINITANGTTSTGLVSLSTPISSFNFANSLVSFDLPGGSVINDGAEFSVRVQYRDADSDFVITSTTGPIFDAQNAGPEPIPEPGTWAAAALLVGGAAFMRWRRRQTA